MPEHAELGARQAGTRLHVLIQLSASRRVEIDDLICGARKRLAGRALRARARTWWLSPYLGLISDFGGGRGCTAMQPTRRLLLLWSRPPDVYALQANCIGHLNRLAAHAAQRNPRMRMVAGWCVSGIRHRQMTREAAWQL